MGFFWYKWMSMESRKWKTGIGIGSEALIDRGLEDKGTHVRKRKGKQLCLNTILEHIKS